MMKHPGVPTRWLSVLTLLAVFFATQFAVAQLNLNVDRGTGITSISNPTGSAVTINGYTILSSRGALKPANGQWNSLQDQAVAGWVESAPVVTDLSELNPLGSSTLNPGGSLPLGSAYQQIVPAFGLDPDHLAFEYNELNGTSTFTGNVVYTGTKLINDLLLTVNTLTGQVQLKNDSPYDVFIDGYAVYSLSGSLQPASGQWNSLDDQNVAGWEEAFPSPSVVSELKQGVAMRLTPGSGFALGALYNSAGGTQDLRLEFLQPGALLPTEGTVVSGAFGAVPAPTPGVLADFDNNGVVDARDYVVWRNSVGTSTLLRNDPVGGVIGAAQYNLWRSNFGNTLAGGSGAVVASVPEPASMLILLLASVPFVWNFRANRS